MILIAILNKYVDKLLNLKHINQIILNFSEKNCLEIGGPSRIFTKKGLLPVYDKVKCLTNINFSYETIWENKIKEGNTFKYGNRIGVQYVLEASNLATLNDNSFEGLMSSHCLEHTANPLKVLIEWKRVLKPDGFLLLILPNKKYTFDNKRPYTTFAHIKYDFDSNLDEHDLTHKEEILNLHDKSKDPGLNLFNETLEERCNANFINRCMHHHIFNTELIQEMCTFTELKLISSFVLRPYHLVFLIKK